MSDLEGHEDRLQPEEEELFQQTRAAIERRWPKTLEHPDHPQCTGISASWCDIHGQCTCPPFVGAETLNEDPKCPLHGAGITRQRSVEIKNIRMGIFCEHCDAEMDQDQMDLSVIRFRRVLCRSCFDISRQGGVLRPNPTRKTY